MRLYLAIAFVLMLASLAIRFRPRRRRRPYRMLVWRGRYRA